MTEQKMDGNPNNEEAVLSNSIQNLKKLQLAFNEHFMQLLPFLGAIISTTILFVSGLVDKMYYSEYYEVFDISPFFVDSPSSTVNKSMEWFILDIIIISLIFISCLFSLSKPVKKITIATNKYKNIGEDNTSWKNNMHFRIELVKYFFINCTKVCCYVYFAILILIFGIADFILDMQKYNSNIVIYDLVTALVIMILIVIICFFYISRLYKYDFDSIKTIREERTKYLKYKQNKKRKLFGRIIDDHRYRPIIDELYNPDIQALYADMKRNDEWALTPQGILFLTIVTVIFISIILLTGASIMGRAGALTQQRYYVNEEDNVCIPVSTTTYAVIETEIKDDCALIYTHNKRFVDNSIIVKTRVFENTSIIDRDGNTITFTSSY